MKNKKLKIFLVIIAVIIVIGAAFVANAFVGNPVSLLLAKSSAKKYLKQQYSDTDFYIESVNYNPKTSGYSAHIASPSSVDSHFTVETDLLGRVRGDHYNYVTSGWNTWLRLDEEYRELVESVFENFEYATDICFGDIAVDESGDERPGVKSEMTMSEFKIDGEYDIKELAKEAGKLTVYAKNNDVSVNSAAEILLRLKEEFDKADVPFFSVDFTLQSGDKPSDNSIFVSGFPYDEITGYGLAVKIEKAFNELSDWYAKEDAKK